MCIHCSYLWKTAKNLGPIYYGSGQICEDKSSWIVWVRLWRFYMGWIPAKCYWKRPYLRLEGSHRWVFGGGKIRNYLSSKRLIFMCGPFDLSLG